MNRALVPLKQHTVRQFKRDSVLATDGPAGRVVDLYFDDQSWKVRYLVIDAGGWFTPHPVLLLPESINAEASGEGVLRLRLRQRQVNEAPAADSARPVFRQTQLAQAVHFGYPYYWSGLMLWAGVAAGRSREEAERAAHAELARGDPHLRSGAALIGCRVEARDGMLGEVHDFVVDERAWAISAVVLETRKWLPGGKRRIAPAAIERIDWSEQRIVTRIERPGGRAPHRGREA